GEPLGSPPRGDSAPPLVRAAAQPPQVPPSPTAPAPTPAPAPAPVSISASTEEIVPPDPRDLASAFAEFSLAPRPVVAPAEGAVDSTRTTPRREAPPPPPPPPPKPVVASRQWVQVATGRDTGALAFDWRRIKRSADGLLDQAKPHIAKWGQTNRLVAG